MYALVDPDRVEPLAFVDAMLAGGIRLVQVRAKRGIASQALDAIVARVRAAGGLAIVNDDPQLALRADGLHLGQEDLAAVDLRAVRAQLGSRIIGVSCGTPQEARAVDPTLVDYVGVGPVFGSTSKDDAGPAIGISGTRAVVEAASVPCAAIGGIGWENLARVKESGAAMAAVLSALCVREPAAAARALVQRWG